MKLTYAHLVYIIPLLVFAAKLLEFSFLIFNIDIASSSTGSLFLSNFIEWFGVIYGLLIPLIMVKIWEQLDAIDREFDREADTVKILYEDIFFLEGKCAEIGKDIAPLLRNYVVHVINGYQQEIKILDDDLSKPTERPTHSEVLEQFIRKTQRITNFVRIDLNVLKELFSRLIQRLQKVWNKARRLGNENVQSTNLSEPVNQKLIGDQLLEEVRHKFRSFFLPNVITTKGSEILVNEMFHRLNEIVDIRGDRISLASQRLFETLRIVALITTIIFLLPFYFVGFTPETRLLDEILIIGVTLLVIFIYLILEDLDEPFGGIWKIESITWKRLLQEMDSAERKTELENLTMKEPESPLSNGEAKNVTV